MTPQMTPLTPPDDPDDRPDDPDDPPEDPHNTFWWPQSDTWNIIRVSNRAAQDMGFKTYQHFLENDHNHMRTSDQIKK